MAKKKPATKPPSLGKPDQKKKGATLRNPQGYAPKTSDELVEDTAKHADEVRLLSKGMDLVELPDQAPERRPAAFDRKELMVVRSWVKSRPLETTPAAAVTVPFPRMWNTKRGRYAKFKAPGAGVYGIVRARPTF